MAKKNKPFRVKAIGKALRKSPLSAGLAVIAAAAAAAAGSPRMRERTRRLGSGLKRRLSRQGDPSMLITESTQSAAPG